MINSVDQFAHSVGYNVTLAQENLMEAFSLREGNAKSVEELARRLNITVLRPAVDENGNPKIDPNTKQPILEAATPDLKGLQLITQQRFEHATQIFNTFSNILEKLDQLKQRLIQKLGQ